MNFWDSINSSLGYPPKEKEKSLWDELQSITDDSQGSPLNAGIQGSSLLPLKAQKISPYDVSVDEINEIARSGKKGFQIFNINPFTLTYGRNKCLIDSRIIWDLIEYEPEIDQSNNPHFPGTILFSWRTVPIEVSGTWVKIEFLPARKNYSNTMNDYDGSNAFDNKTLDYNPDQTPSEGMANVGGAQPLDPNNKEDRNSSRQILVQFESPTSPVLIAKHGETYKLPFNKIFVSMRQMSPRIRLTIGYNSEITNTENEAVVNKDLALGPGNGLWNSPTMYPYPFSNTFNFDSSANFNILFDQTSMAIFPDGTTAPRVKNGVGVFWITNLSYSIYAEETGSAEIQLMKQSGNVMKSYFHKIAFVSKIAPLINGDITFPVPIRVVLGPAQQFVILSNSTFGSHGTLTYCVSGYALGKTRNAASFDTQGTQYLQTLSENPFPEDYSDSPLNDTGIL